MKGHLRERSPGHWDIVLDVRDPATGKRKRRWHSFAGTKRQAQVECARLISEMQGGTYLEPGKLTIAAYVARWLERVRKQIPKSTSERYSEIVTKNIQPELATAKLAKLTALQ